MRHKSILEYVAHGTELESSVVPAQLLIEILGSNRVLIENHKGVCQYSDHCIQVRTTKGFVSISGSRMQISYITKEKIIILGHIESVTFQAGERNAKISR